jgi:hypothetical protein
MINAATAKIDSRSCLSSGIQISLLFAWLWFPAAASADSYPINGVWVAATEHYSGAEAGVCSTLKMLGVDAFRDRSFPQIVIFSEGKKFDVSGDYQIEQIIKSAKNSPDGEFQITESLSKRGKWPWLKKRSYSLKMIDPVTIEITEGKVTTLFVKCTPKERAL